MNEILRSKCDETTEKYGNIVFCIQDVNGYLTHLSVSSETTKKEAVKLIGSQIERVRVILYYRKKGELPIKIEIIKYE